MQGTDFSLRVVPQQSRSRETFEKILVSAAELLEQVGYEGFNTNLLAERAGVSTRALYRYFPNKFAVLAALAEKFSEAEREWNSGIKALGSSSDWRKVVEESVDNYFQAAKRQTGYTALRFAVQALPELKKLDELSSRELHADLMAGLLNLGAKADNSSLDAICQIIVDTGNCILDSAVKSPREFSDRIVEEFKKMIICYLSMYLQ